ncbi:MAG: hypothetical protein R3F26_03530 [Gammaproteobacteria bacterium]|nr:hypothetical protein [Pseudomonadales bacterium]
MKKNNCLINRKRAALMGSLFITLLPIVVLADDCAYEQQLNFTLPSAAVRTVDISAGSGSLKVYSTPTAKEVSVNARLCAKRERNLEGMGVDHVMQADTLHLWTRIPDSHSGFWSRGYASIDLEVQLPEGMAANVTDGSGELSISGTGDLQVVDGSGTLDIFAIAGSVTVDDGSGSMSIEDVRGDVSVDDGSGDIDIARIGGSVTLRDGSGSINVREVQQEVSILEDGSGSVNIDREMRYSSASANLE